MSLAEWSKALRSGRNIFGCKSSNLLAHNFLIIFTFSHKDHIVLDIILFNIDESYATNLFFTIITVTFGIFELVLVASRCFQAFLVVGRFVSKIFVLISCAIIYSKFDGS